MKPRMINEHIASVGAIDWDRRLFDGLIPLPDGTSYNSYLLRGTEKTALIDAVDPAKSDIIDWGRVYTFHFFPPLRVRIL